MPVFKAYIQIIRKNAPLLLMYLGIVVGLAVMMTIFNAQSPQTGFSGSQVRTAIFNDDEKAGSALVAGLADYLAQTAEIIDLADDPQKFAMRCSLAKFPISCACRTVL